MAVQQWEGRTSLLVGEENIEQLHKAHVLIVGLGGVGSYAAEAICRAGIGNITIVDGDKVEASNRNRQLPALSSTEGQWKVDIMAARLRDINPDVNLTIHKVFVKDDVADEILDTRFDYVMDCIDTLAPKVHLIRKSRERGYPVVSSLGAAGRIRPELIRIEDISYSHNCHLAFYVRKKLRRHGIENNVTVVYSPETIDKEGVQLTETLQNKRSFLGTISFIPASFGLFCASVVIRTLLGQMDRLPVKAKKRRQTKKNISPTQSDNTTDP